MDVPPRQHPDPGRDPLMVELFGRDLEAFVAEVISRHRATIGGLVNHELNDESRVGEVTDDVFSTFWEIAARGGFRYQTEPQLIAYLRRIGENKCSNDNGKSENRLTWRSSDPNVHASSDHHDDQAARTEEVIAVADAVARLDPQDRLYLHLDGIGYSKAEAARLVDLHPKTYGRHLEDAYRRFRALYREDLR